MENEFCGYLRPHPEHDYKEDDVDYHCPGLDGRRQVGVRATTNARARDVELRDRLREDA